MMQEVKIDKKINDDIKYKITKRKNIKKSYEFMEYFG